MFWLTRSVLVRLRRTHAWRLALIQHPVVCAELSMEPDRVIQGQQLWWAELVQRNTDQRRTQQKWVGDIRNDTAVNVLWTITWRYTYRHIHTDRLTDRHIETYRQTQKQVRDIRNDTVVNVLWIITYTERGTQTDRHTNRNTDTYRQRDKQADTETSLYMQRYSGECRHLEVYICTQRDRQTDRHRQT